MIKKIISLFLALSLLFGSQLKADEGMWLPFVIQMKMAIMQDMGLELTAEDIYSINQSSIKDAIVALDHGSCTAELISPNGLLLTNHHCGYGEIQAHSTVEHDYLTNGFWAQSRDQELSNPGKTATIVVRIDDVSDRVNAVLNPEMSHNERNAAIKEISKKIETQAVEGTHYDADVRSFFKGNQFYVIVSETFKDVRLVGAPPSAIGKFGGDTDNWMWPRHTGDFSLFRIYTAPDGSPAEYSPDNVPYKPRHFLPISIKGVEKGDFAMVFGFPGSTQRYLTSWGVKNEIENVNKTRIKVRGVKLDVLKEDMDKSDKIRIQYASKYSRSSNYWKYSIGQNKGLKALNVIAKKQQIEKDFEQWVSADAERQKKYGEALNLIKTAYQKLDQHEKVSNYWFEALYLGPDVLRFALRARSIEAILQRDPSKTQAIEAEIEKLREGAKDFFKDYNAPTDEKLVAAMLKVYAENIDPKFHPAAFTEMKEKYGGCENFASKMIHTSIFANEQKFEDFLNKPNHESVFFQSQIILFPYFALPLYKVLKEDAENQDAIAEQKAQLQQMAEKFFEDFNAEQASADFVELFGEFYKTIPTEKRPAIFEEVINKKFKGDVTKFAEKMFKKSIFADKKAFEKFLKSPKLKTLEKDLAFQTMLSMHEIMRFGILENDLAFRTMKSALQIYFGVMQNAEKYQNQLSRGQRLLVAGLLEMNPDKAYYPDANSTLRLTYGTVGDYQPRDAVIYKHYTTLDGYMEKEDPNSDEFTVPDKLKELYKKKDYGRWANKDGKMWVCFTTNNDITGGNSGSPVINGKGQLIGCAFDGNWEAMSGDIAFEPELQKCINVDIRYVLFIIDKYAGASHLIDEMKIVQ